MPFCVFQVELSSPSAIFHDSSSFPHTHTRHTKWSLMTQQQQQQEQQTTGSWLHVGAGSSLSHTDLSRIHTGSTPRLVPDGAKPVWECTDVPHSQQWFMTWGMSNTDKRRLKNAETHVKELLLCDWLSGKPAQLKLILQQINCSLWKRYWWAECPMKQVWVPAIIHEDTKLRRGLRQQPDVKLYQSDHLQISFQRFTQKAPQMRLWWRNSDTFYTKMYIFMSQRAAFGFN